MSVLFAILRLNVIFSLVCLEPKLFEALQQSFEFPASYLLSQVERETQIHDLRCQSFYHSQRTDYIYLDSMYEKTLE